MENYQLYLVERDWQRFKRQYFFFLVKWWKTYQLFINSCNRCRIRKGILHKNSSRSFSWRTVSQAVILFSVTKTLSWQKNKSRYSMTFLREDTTMMFEKSSHKPSTPRWRDKKIIQENRSGESFERITWDYNIHTLFRTHSWVVKRMWVLYTCE